MRHTLSLALIAALGGGAVIAQEPAPQSRPGAGRDDVATLGRNPYPRPLPRQARENLFILPQLYVEAGVSVLDFTLTRPSNALATGDTDRVAGTLRGGLAFNEFLALEIDANILETDTAFVTPTDSSGLFFAPAEDPDQLVATMLRASYPFGDRFAAHARAGYGVFDSEVASAGVSRDDGAAFGAGVRYRLAGPAGVRTDYTRYEFADTAADAVTLSLSLEF